MRRFVLIIGLLAAAAGLAAADEVFRFSYEEGEQYRVLSTVEQDVWLNDVFSHHATIFNRIAIAVTEVEEGRGFHDATFVTSEESVNGEQAFRWGEEYHSRFWRGERGHRRSARGHLDGVGKRGARLPTQLRDTGRIPFSNPRDLSI